MKSGAYPFSNYSPFLLGYYISHLHTGDGKQLRIVEPTCRPLAKLTFLYEKMIRLISLGVFIPFSYGCELYWALN